MPTHVVKIKCLWNILVIIIFLVIITSILLICSIFLENMLNYAYAYMYVIYLMRINNIATKNWIRIATQFEARKLGRMINLFGKNFGKFGCIGQLFLLVHLLVICLFSGIKIMVNVIYIECRKFHFLNHLFIKRDRFACFKMSVYRNCIMCFSYPNPPELFTSNECKLL